MQQVSTNVDSYMKGIPLVVDVSDGCNHRTVRAKVTTHTHTHTLRPPCSEQQPTAVPHTPFNVYLFSVFKNQIYILFRTLVAEGGGNSHLCPSDNALCKAIRLRGVLKKQADAGLNLQHLPLVKSTIGRFLHGGLRGEKRTAITALPRRHLLRALGFAGHLQNSY